MNALAKIVTLMAVVATALEVHAQQTTEATKVYDSMKGRVSNAHAVCGALGGDERPTVLLAEEAGTSVHCKVRFKDGRINEQHAGSVSFECPPNHDLVETNRCLCTSDSCKARNEAAPSQQAAEQASTSPLPASPGKASAPPADCGGRRGATPPKSAAKPSQAKAARMPEHRAQCFSIDAFQDNAQLKEFAAQLRRQQEALNQMTVGDFISGMSWYAAKRQEGARVPRKGEEAKQKAMRDQYSSTIKASMVKSMQCHGMTEAEAKAKAEAKLPAVTSRLQALHEPDIALTGSEVTRLGAGKVNGEIGRQWAEQPGGRYSDDSRRYRLLADVMQAQSTVGDEALLNVVLEPCRR